MSIFSICKHTIQEYFESEHRKSHNNVTEIYSDKATFTKKMSVIGLSACWSLKPECKRVTSLFCCFRVVVHNLVRRYY